MEERHFLKNCIKTRPETHTQILQAQTLTSPRVFRHPPARPLHSCLGLRGSPATPAGKWEWEAGQHQCSRGKFSRHGAAPPRSPTWSPGQWRWHLAWSDCCLLHEGTKGVSPRPGSAGQGAACGCAAPPGNRRVGEQWPPGARCPRLLPRSGAELFRMLLYPPAWLLQKLRPSVFPKSQMAVLFTNLLTINVTYTRKTLL